MIEASNTINGNPGTLVKRAMVYISKSIVQTSLALRLGE